MGWSVTNLIIQIAAGFLGSHAAAIALKDHQFGFIGHSLAGLLGGAVSGFFFQVLVNTVVMGNGEVMTASPADIFVLQALAGAVAGGIAMMSVGVIRHLSGIAKT
ncbi:MAG: hypothetical protein J0G33_12400 [Afipia felis]|nr:hypothetical protein [Afipia felis]